MNIQIRNLKINKTFSEETLCFVASLYIDDNKVADVRNDGHGGSHYMHWINGGLRAAFEVAAMERLGQDHPSIRESKYAQGLANDWLIDCLVGDCERRKLAERLLKKIAWIHGNDVWAVKGVLDENMRHTVSQRYPGAVILNDHTVDEVIDMLRVIDNKGAAR